VEKKKGEELGEKKKWMTNSRIKEKIDWHGTAPRHYSFFPFINTKKNAFPQKK